MDSSNPIENREKDRGKILNIWSRCIAKPSSLLSSSLVRLWSQVDVKNRLTTLTVKRVDFVSKCLKRLPEVSLNCHVSASFSLKSAKTEPSEEENLEKQERCRKIARIEYEIRALERHLDRKKSPGI